jgi:uncharacterized protein (DUF2062 family)
MEPREIPNIFICVVIGGFVAWVAWYNAVDWLQERRRRRQQELEFSSKQRG